MYGIGWVSMWSDGHSKYFEYFYESIIRITSPIIHYQDSPRTAYAKEKAETVCKVKLSWKLTWIKDENKHFVRRTGADGKFILTWPVRKEIKAKDNPVASARAKNLTQFLKCFDWINVLSTSLFQLELCLRLWIVWCKLKCDPGIMFHLSIILFVELLGILGDIHFPHFGDAKRCTNLTISKILLCAAL